MWRSGIIGFLKVVHRHIELFVLGDFFGNVATAAVFGNTIVLALDGTFNDDSTVAFLDTLNTSFSYLFIVEMGCKLVGLTPLGKKIFMRLQHKLVNT